MPSKNPTIRFALIGGKNYLKQNQNIPEHKLVKTDYFHDRREKFQDLQKQEHEIREKIHKAIVVF